MFNLNQKQSHSDQNNFLNKPLIKGTPLSVNFILGMLNKRCNKENKKENRVAMEIFGSIFSKIMHR
jgi:hypothetical protein